MGWLSSVCHDDIAQRAAAVQFHEWETGYNKNLSTCCLIEGWYTIARGTEETRDNSRRLHSNIRIPLITCSIPSLVQHQHEMLAIHIAGYDFLQ